LNKSTKAHGEKFVEILQLQESLAEHKRVLGEVTERLESAWKELFRF
jgi:hypothetical protein